MDEAAVSVIVSALTAFGVVVLAELLRRSHEAAERKRDVFASALAAVAAYQEFPYIVRRRGVANPEAERLRISEALSEVQKEITYYLGWLTIESGPVADAYRVLVTETRQVAGREISAGWDLEPMNTDEGMHMPPLGMEQLEPSKEAYLKAVRSHLSLRGRLASLVRRTRGQ